MTLSTLSTYWFGDVYNKQQSLKSIQITGACNTCLHKNNPSHRILRLCDFMSQFDFEDVKFVRGVDAAVPNLFYRDPWVSFNECFFVFQQRTEQERW